MLQHGNVYPRHERDSIESCNTKRNGASVANPHSRLLAGPGFKSLLHIHLCPTCVFSVCPGNTQRGYMHLQEHAPVGPRVLVRESGLSRTSSCWGIPPPQGFESYQCTGASLDCMIGTCVSTHCGEARHLCPLVWSLTCMKVAMLLFCTCLNRLLPPAMTCL